MASREETEYDSMSMSEDDIVFTAQELGMAMVAEYRTLSEALAIVNNWHSVQKERVSNLLIDWFDPVNCPVYLTLSKWPNASPEELKRTKESLEGNISGMYDLIEQLTPSDEEVDPEFGSENFRYSLVI